MVKSTLIESLVDQNDLKYASLKTSIQLFQICLSSWGLAVVHRPI